MRFDAVSDDADAPHVTMERILSSRLIQFWFSIRPVTPNQESAYDPAYVEELYEKLCQEYVARLPPAFAFEDPDTRWDQKLPVLPRQRLMLRISVLVIVCQLFRPLLLLDLVQIRAMPQYKRSLVLSQRGQLVNTANSLLDSVSSLHDLMGGVQTRYFLISFYTFEPAVILGMHIMSVNLAAEALREAQSSSRESSNRLWSSPAAAFEAVDRIHADQSSIERCRRYIKNAYEKLDMLKEVNIIAMTGVRELGHMLARLDGAAARNEENDHDERAYPDTTTNCPIEVSNDIGDATMMTFSSQDPITSPWRDFSLSQGYFLNDTTSISRTDNAYYPNIDDFVHNTNSHGTSELAYGNGARGSDGTSFY